MNPRADTNIMHDAGIKAPGMYAVVIHNDDVTTMDFVVEVLTEVFRKPPQEAAALMMDVHEKGRGIAGIYIFDIAVTKKAEADRRSAEKGFPLRLTLREMV